MQLNLLIIGISFLTDTLRGENAWDFDALDEIAGLSECFRQLGFLDFGFESPLSVIKAAHYRQVLPRQQKNRVIGIMQVFDLQLGASNPKADPAHTFTLPELEGELSAALIMKYPILSQQFKHTKPAVIGKAWRCGQYIRLPRHSLYGMSGRDMSSKHKNRENINLLAYLEPLL